jgi:hypothetical protein
MSLAEKEFLAWYACKEFSKEKRDLLQVDAFVADEMNRYPAPPELLTMTKRVGRPLGSGKPLNPNSLRGLIEFFMNEKKVATKFEIREFLEVKKPGVAEAYFITQLAAMCKKGLYERRGWGDETVFTLKAA